MLHVINTMEFWVEKCMAEVIAKSDVCTCDKCLKDIYALTLNRLKPNYIISTKGINSKELDSKFEIVKDTIIDQIKISIDKIKNNPSNNKDHIESVANCAEIYVEEYVPKIIEESDMCKYDECINEVYKFILNNIRPCYYVSKEGSIILNLKREEYKTNIVIETEKAIEYVKNNNIHVGFKL